MRQIYQVAYERPKMRIPPTMDTGKLGPASELENQLVVKVTNAVSGRVAAFNALRARRPMPFSDPNDQAIKDLLTPSNCAFCYPEQQTPEELPFGRIRGKHSVTAANAASYAGACGLVILQKHNPLEVSEEDLHDAFGTAYKWFMMQNTCHPDASCPSLVWNVLPRSASSLIHTHLQVCMEEGGSLPEVEDLKRGSDLYALRHNRSFFEDIIRAHEALGLGFQLPGGSAVLAELTPLKEKGAMVIMRQPWHDFAQLAHAVYVVMQALIASGTQSFNMVSYLPSLKLDYGWDRQPAVVRFMDRGPLTAKNSDVGGMEWLGKSVISSDPYAVMQHLVTASTRLSGSP